MPTIAIETTGFDSLAKALERAQARAASPGVDFMRRIATEILADGMRLAIRTQGTSTGTPFAALSPVTKRIRAFYGHASGALVRRGDLLASISGEAADASSAAAVAAIEYAGIVDQGGQNRDGVQIPARPFAVVSDADADRIAEQVADVIVEELEGDA